MNLTLINNDTIEIYVKPRDDWHLYYNTYVENYTLNLTWVVHVYENNTMEINVTFNEPYEVSPMRDGERDELILHVKDPSLYFMSAKYLIDLHPENRTMKINIPK